MNMVVNGQSDEVGLFFVRFFGAALHLAAGMGAAGVSCGLHGKGGRRKHAAGGGDAIVHCRVDFWRGYCLPCT